MSLTSTDQVLKLVLRYLIRSSIYDHRQQFLSYLRWRPHEQELKKKFPSKANSPGIKFLILSKIVSFYQLVEMGLISGEMMPLQSVIIWWLNLYMWTVVYIVSD